MQISVLVPTIVKFEKFVKCANEVTGDIIHSTQLYIKYRNRAILISQFAAQTIETWQANRFTGNTPMAIKFCSYGNSLFSSPHSLDFNRSVIFSSQNIKWGHKCEWSSYMLTGSSIWGTICTYQNGTPKVARNAFDIGEVWNPVCCHGNQTVALTLWSTFSTILLPRIKHFWYRLAKKSFFIIFDQNLGECNGVITGLINLHYFKNLNISGTKRDIWI